MIPWILLGFFLSIPLLAGYSFIPVDLLAVIEPWARPLLPFELTNHYFTDTMGETYPWKVLFSQCIKSGIWPIWNPYNQFGSPYLAISTQQAFDPFNILYFFLPTRWAFDWLLVLKTIFSGYFMSRLLASYDIQKIGQWIGGLCYAFSGAMVLNAEFCWMQGAFVWLPLVVLHLERIRNFNDQKSVGYGALFLGFALLGGNLQTTLQLGLFLLLWICRSGFSIPIFFTLVLGGMIGSVALFPTLELFQINAGSNYAVTTWFANLGTNLTKIPFMVSFFLPHFFGHPTTYSPISFLGGNWSEILQGFVGLIPFSLAVIAILFLSKNNIVRKYRFIAISFLLILFLTPFVEWIYLRSLVFWAFSVAILAAICAEQIEAEDSDLKRGLQKLGKTVKWGILILIPGLLILQLLLHYFEKPLIDFGNQIVALKIQNFAFDGLKPLYFEKVAATIHYYSFTQIPLLITLGLLLLFYAGLRIAGGGDSGRKMITRLFLGLTLLDALYFAYTYIPIADLKKYPLYPKTPAIEFLKKDTEKFRVLKQSRQGDDAQIFFLASNAVWEIEAVQQETSLHYDTAHRFQQLLLRQSPGNSFDPTLADLANVKYILTNSDMLDTKRYPLVYQGEINIFLNPHAKPRAFFPTKWEEVANEEAAFAKLSGEYQNQGSDFVYLQGSPDLPKWLGESKGSIKMLRHFPTEVVLKTETQEARLLVLSEALYPGWKAAIDEEETTIYRANALFRAIRVPAGKHTIRFLFQPLSFRLGLWTSISGLLVAVFLILFKRKIGLSERACVNFSPELNSKLPPP